MVLIPSMLCSQNLNDRTAAMDSIKNEMSRVIDILSFKNVFHNRTKIKLYINEQTSFSIYLSYLQICLCMQASDRYKHSQEFKFLCSIICLHRQFRTFFGGNVNFHVHFFFQGYQWAATVSLY